MMGQVVVVVVVVLQTKHSLTVLGNGYRQSSATTTSTLHRLGNDIEQGVQTRQSKKQVSQGLVLSVVLSQCLFGIGAYKEACPLVLAVVAGDDSVVVVLETWRFRTIDDLARHGFCLGLVNIVCCGLYGSLGV